jgi:anti-sigma factor RsiW
MTRHDLTDEILMAYADGEADADTVRAVEAAVASDAAVAQRLAVFTGTRDALSRAAAARPLDPLTDALRERIARTLADANEPANVVPFRRTAWAAQAFRPLAAAASLALAVGLAGGYLMSQAGKAGDAPGLRIAALDSPAIPGALSSLASGDREAIAGGDITIVASFVNAAGEFCREFEFVADRDMVASVACMAGTGWEPRLAVVAASGDGSTYAPASSLDTLDAYLSAIGAGAPLSREDEAAALARLGN